MEGKVSEIIDNVIDTDDYLNPNTQESFNSANSWNKLTYLDNNNKIFKKEKEKNKLPSPIEVEKEDNNSNKNEINNIIINKESRKILNENLFKGKGFRTNIDFFLKNNSENLSLSGINDITSLSEYPNVFTCSNPRPGTNRYKKANKSNLFYNSFYGKERKEKIGDNTNKIKNLGHSLNKKTLPKIKNNQIEERKNPGNKNKINKSKNK